MPTTPFRVRHGIVIESTANTAPIAANNQVLTGSANTSLVDLATTWNTTGNPTAIKLNVTNTASGASSALMDLQVGGSSFFKIDKTGNISIKQDAGAYEGMIINQSYDTTSFGATTGSFRRFIFSTAIAFGINNINTQMRGDSLLGWTTSTNALGTYDVVLARDISIANTSFTGLLGQRNGVNPQTYRLYGTYTDASNYERLSLSANSSGHYIIGEEGGTGSARPLYLGANNATVVTISASGNVGIGTTTPASRLHVASSNNSTLSAPTETSIIGPSYSSSLIIQQLANAANTFSAISFYNTFDIQASIGATYVGTGYGAGGDLFFNTRAPGGSGTLSERMRITSAGNVGIGNTAPISRLTVDTGISVTAGAAGALPYVELFRSGQSHWKLQHLSNGLGIQNSWSSQTYRSALVMDDGLGISTQEILRLAYFGGVGAIGVGISAPTAKLTVANGTSPTSQHNYGTYTDASNYERINLTANSSGHYIIGEKAGTGSARPLYLGANNVTVVTVNSDKSVVVKDKLYGRSSIDHVTYSIFESSIDEVYLLNNNSRAGSTGYPPATLYIGGLADGRDAFRLYANTIYLGAKTSVVRTQANPNTTNWITGGSFSVISNPGSDNFAFGINDNRTYAWLQYWSSGTATNISINPLGGNVGIGTTTPTSNLHVFGTANITGTTLINSYTLSSTSLSDAAYFTLNRSATGLHLGQGYPIFWSTSVGNLANPVRLVGGRVTGLLEQRSGVDPQNFTVYGTYTDASNYERFAISANSTGNFLSSEAAGTGTARDIKIAAGSSSVILTTSGFANFGATKVYGSNWGAGYHDSALTAGIFEIANGVDTVWVKLTADAANNMAQRNGTNPQTYRLYGTYTDVSNYERINLTANSTGHYIIGEEAGTGSARPLYLGSNNVTRMTITEGGNVGIGTTSPSRLLDVNGTARISSVLTMGSYIQGTTQLDLYGDSTSSVGVRLTSAGNVGIGVTSPSSALDVNGKITTRFGGALRGYFGAPSWDTSYISMQHALLTESASSAAINQSSAGDTTLNAAVGRSLLLRINNDSGGQGQLEFTSRKFVFSGSNVAIGMTAPTAKFTVADGTSPTSQHNYGTYTDASNYERINLTANSSGHYIIGEKAGTGSARPLYLGSNNVTRMTITDDGNVGIGTTSPLQKLHISGGHALIGGTYGLYFNDGSTARIVYDQGQYRIHGIGSTIPIVFLTNSIERMLISNTGNVGIGTITPTSKLDVNSDSIRVRTAKTPASNTATGNQGDICWDENYIYVCTATDTWKRSSISTW